MEPVVDGLAMGFKRYGRFVSRPVPSIVCIVATVIVAGGLSAGITQQTTASAAREIFTPVGSAANANDARIGELYPGNSTDSSIFIVRVPGATGAWSGGAVVTLERVWNASLSVRARVGGVSFGLADICVPGPFGGCDRTFAPDCLTPSDLGAMGANGSSSGPPSPSSPAPAPVPLVSAENRVCVRQADGALVFAPLNFGTSVSVRARSSPGSQPYPWAAAELTQAESMSITFSYASSSRPSALVPGKSEKALSAAFERAWLDRAAELQEQAEREGWLAAYSSEASVGIALDQSTSGDILLVVVAIVLLVSFGVVSGASSDCVRSRHCVAVGGVAAVALGIPASFGLMALCGVPYVATVGTTPFLVLGVGVDSVFVIASSFNRRPARESVEERIGHALFEAGPAIALTTLTDVIAFAIGGATSPFLAVLYFCLYTGVALALAFLFILTAFVPLLAADGRREAAGRSAATCLPSRAPVIADKAGSPAPKELESRFAATAARTDTSTDEPGRGGAPVAAESPAAPEAGAPPEKAAQPAGAPAAPASPDNGTASPRGVEAPPSPKGGRHPPDGAVAEQYQGRGCDVFFGNVVASAVTSAPGVVVIMVLWVAALAYGGYLWSTLGEGLALSELAIDGNPLIRYDEWNTELYSLGFPYTVFTDRHPPLDIANGPIRVALRDLPQAIVDRSATVVSTGDNFFTVFANALGPNGTDTVPAAQSDAVLVALLADPSVSAKFGSSVLWHRRPADGSPGVDIALENGFPQARAALLAGDRVLVRSARLQVRTEPLAESTARAKSMTETRQATADAVAALAPPGSGLDATLQFEAFIFFEADVILPTSTYTSLGLGAAAIAIVTLVLLPHLAAVLVVVVAVASIDVMLLGSMPLFGIKLNTVSGINLLLSIGLSVDAVAHVTHAFLHADGPLRAASTMVKRPFMEDTTPPSCWGLIGGAERRRRAVAAVLTMARPVFQGTGSSMLGLVTLAFSTSSIFRTFFTILFTTMVLSLVHAVFVIPVLLRILGPATTLHTHDPGALEGDSESSAASVAVPAAPRKPASQACRDGSAGPAP
ncbi:hypothetical protein FNF31_01468 [Cafeteria roenbergensis]|uniref:SSD domain-containing protein n=2 Tax=Cafeteria roenbergensis TaxID=33653 RepID=A0A5A8DLJ0_CAFRO|nr:hypothetical protein FNF31_01468 [Cafeteria roenbergensis]